MDTEEPVKEPVNHLRRNISYVCDVCGNDVGKGNVYSKQVRFQTVGTTYKTLRTRIVAWLCRPCMEADPAWTQDALGGSPGMRDTKLNPANRRK